MMKYRNILKEFLLITGGTVIAAAAIYFFMLPSHIAVGSGSALAMILSNYIPLPVSALSLIIPSLYLFVKKNRLTNRDPKRRKKAQNERTCVRFCRTLSTFCVFGRTIFATFLDKRAFCLYNGRRNKKRKENR